MAYFVITYDVRKNNPDDYQTLYDQLGKWNAAHLQNSVWLADLNGDAASVRKALAAHVRTSDTICVIQIFPNSDWAWQQARKEGGDWLQSHCNK